MAADRSRPGRCPLPSACTARGNNNLRDVDVDVPLWCTVAVVGVSGSGKTSLALGTLYAEGMQRYLSGLSTYSRRRLTQVQRPDVDRIDHLPPALALLQRPPVPGRRSIVGTMSETLNVLRLMMSRLGSHLCPNGHRIGPSIAKFAEEIVCSVCGARFEHPSAESLAFNSCGACPARQGLGVRSEVDETTVVPDPDKTIEEGAVLPWNSGCRRLSMHAAGELGVRLDVPYGSLTEREREIVMHGAPVQRQVTAGCAALITAAGIVVINAAAPGRSVTRRAKLVALLAAAIGQYAVAAEFDRVLVRRPWLWSVAGQPRPRWPPMSAAC